ncbi:MAG: LysE family transporter [Tannerella sp.]|jgi:threonine/homoserine/homoserine lactone efflux protein|nr:LysE family transporter [Tannerella sp.]
MLGLVTKGIIIGVLVSAPMGPVGILCIQRTLSKGRWHGFVSGLGATVSDVIYAALTIFFMGLVINFVETNQRYLEIFGSIVLGLVGYYIFRSNPVKSLQKSQSRKRTYLQDFVTAFLLTFSNVLIVLMYIALFARFTFILPTHSVWQSLEGLSGIALGAILWWFVITFIVSKLRRWFNIRGIRLLNQTVGGIILVLSVAGLIYSIV